MVKVKVTTHNHHEIIKFNLLKQTSGLTGIIDNFNFLIEKNEEKFDYWLVFDFLPNVESIKCRRKNTILVLSECSSIKEYNPQFINQFAYVITCQERVKTSGLKINTQVGHVWFPLKTYDELITMPHIEKTKSISIITSSKSSTDGHKKRLDFCLKLKEEFTTDLDLFGRGINDFNDKWDVLAPYKYSIAIENSVEKNWITEKLHDCFLSHTFPLYYGAPNIFEYHSHNSLALIDIDNFDSTCKIINTILSEKNHYEAHIDHLISAKINYLNKYSLYPMIKTLIENGIIQKDNIPLGDETTTLYPESYFYKNSLLDFFKKKLKGN